MSQGFFKRNEKLFMVLLLLVLAPTFAFTGLMSAVIGDGTDVDTGLRVGGRTISTVETKKMRDELSVYVRANGFRGYPGIPGLNSAPIDIFGQQMQGDPIERQFALEAEARERGIVVSDEDFQARIRELGIYLIAWMKATESQPANGSNLFQAYQQVQQLKDTTPFVVSEYMEAVKKLIGKPIREFEASARRAFLAEKMCEVPGMAVVASEKDLWSKFDENMHKRSFEVVRVPVTNFEKLGEMAVTEALAERGSPGWTELATYYASNLQEFTLPNRVKLQALRLDSVNFNLSYQPTDEEIQARFDRDKESLYLATEEFDPFEEVADEFLPLTEVKGQVVQSLREEYVATQGVKILEDAIAAARTRGEGDFSMLDLVPEEKRQFFTVIDTDLFSSEEIAGLPTEISNPAALQELFLTFEQVKKGMVCDEPVQMADASFIYRVTDVAKSTTPSFKANEDAARKAWTTVKAQEKAVELLEDWATEINKEGSTSSLRVLANASNYSVSEFGPLTRSESSQMKIDDKLVDDASAILRNAFTIAEPNSVGVPELNSQSTEAYLVYYKERSDPDATGFAGRRESLKTQVLKEKRNQAIQDYVAAVVAKHIKREEMTRDPEDSDEESKDEASQ